MKYTNLILISMLSFSSVSSAENLPEITLCVPESRSEFMEILAVIARDHGFFEKQGMRVNIQEERKMSEGKWRVIGGKVSRPQALDFAVADKVAYSLRNCTYGASTVERYLSGSADQKLTKALFVSSFGDQYDTHMMVPKSSKLKSVKELRGKTVRIGQLPTYLATAGMLEANGMTMNDVKLGRGNGNDKFGPVFEGKVDATTAYLPTMAFFLATDQMRILEANIVQKYLGRRIPHSLLIVNSDYADKNPSHVLKFQIAMKEAHSYLLRNRGEIFHSYIRSKSKSTKEWKSKNLAANIEKAASFVGDVPFVDLAGNSESKFSTYCDVQNYGSELVRRGLFDKSLDLRAWMGVSEGAGKCPSVPGPNRMAKAP